MGNLLAAVPRDLHPIAKQFIRHWKGLGRTDDQIAQSLMFGVNYTGAPDAIGDEFNTFATTKLGLAPEEAALMTNTSEDLRNHINTKGFEGLPAEPVDEVQSILDDIRAYRRQWPNDVPKEMEAEELRLLSAQIDGTPVTTKPAAATAGADRLAEIREGRRNDPHAWEGNKALQAEELSLIEASLKSGGAATAPAPSASPSQSMPAPTGGGAVVSQQPASSSEGGTASV